MRGRPRRGWILGLGLAGIAMYALVSVGWVFQGFSCDGQSYETEQTVRCDTVRGHSWFVAQQALVALGGLVVIVALGWALRKARLWPLAAAAPVAAVILVAVSAIGDIVLAAKPLPRLTGVRVLDRRCAKLCAQGLRVTFTNDRAAAVELDFGPAAPSTHASRHPDRYDPQVVAPTGASIGDGSSLVPPGTHTVRIALVKRAFTRRRKPLHPGAYYLEITALLPNAGNQSRYATTVRRTFSVLAARGR